MGAHAVGGIVDAELLAIERAACPTIGSCAGMFTGNTMASVGEAIGMSLPGSASAAAIDRRRADVAFASGHAVMNLLREGIRPRQIMTRAAFENAIAVVMALGGSTNAVLHLMAIAFEAGVELELEDFNRVAAKVPHLADTKPHGKYHMVDMDRCGGVPGGMQRLTMRDYCTLTRSLSPVGRWQRTWPCWRFPRLTARSSTPLVIRSTPSAAWPFCGGRWPQRAQWSRWQV